MIKKILFIGTGSIKQIDNVKKIIKSECKNHCRSSIYENILSTYITLTDQHWLTNERIFLAWRQE